MSSHLDVLRLSHISEVTDEIALSSLSPVDVLDIAALGSFIKFAGGGCSLDMHPGKSNWVEKAGGLPNYICEIAKDIVEGGSDVSRAIAIAVGRCKVWAAGGGGVSAKTQAKASKAVAQWERLKAKSKSHAGK